MNNQLLLDILYISSIASIISSQMIQKIKQTFNLGKLFNKIISILISFSVGFLYSLSFYSPVVLYASWIGLFTCIGAEGLYKTFKGYFGLSSLNKEEVNK